MRKKKKCQSQETTIKISEIDYDKLAEAVTKAILKSKEEELKKSESEEEKELERWRNKLGFKEHSNNESIFKTKMIDFYNSLIALKTIVFYKKDYAKETNFSFGIMAIICSYIFELLEILFLILFVLIILSVAMRKLSPLGLLTVPIVLFFAKIMRIIQLEIDEMRSNEMINMIFSSLMAFIAALFTVLAFIRG